MTTRVAITAVGVDRIPGAKAGDTFPVDHFTDRAYGTGHIAHVRDANGTLWSLGVDDWTQLPRDLDHPTHDFVSLGEEGFRCNTCDTNRGGRGSRDICPGAFDNAPQRPDVYGPKVVGMILTEDDGSICIGVAANPIALVVADGATDENVTTSLSMVQAIRLRDLLDKAINEAAIKRQGEIHLAKLAYERQAVQA